MFCVDYYVLKAWLGRMRICLGRHEMHHLFARLRACKLGKQGWYFWWVLIQGADARPCSLTVHPLSAYLHLDFNRHWRGPQAYYTVLNGLKGNKACYILEHYELNINISILDSSNWLWGKSLGFHPADTWLVDVSVTCRCRGVSKLASKLPNDVTAKILDMAAPLRPSCKVEFDFCRDSLETLIMAWRTSGDFWSGEYPLSLERRQANITTIIFYVNCSWFCILSGPYLLSERDTICRDTKRK